MPMPVSITFMVTTLAPSVNSAISALPASGNFIASLYRFWMCVSKAFSSSAAHKHATYTEVLSGRKRLFRFFSVMGFLRIGGIHETLCSAISPKRP